MNQIAIGADLGRHTISRHIYGHFAEHLGRCIYEGVWVGEDSPIPNTRGIRNDVVEALRGLKIPNLRWPGGCFADEYCWTDGIGPRADRPEMINTHWGGVTENNHFGTHEFMDLCGQLDCEPYICGNVGSGTVREMQKWIEYLTAESGPMARQRAANGRKDPWKVRFWGVGNENWGCGGRMRPEYYADEYRRYSTYCRNLDGNKLYKVACGPNGGNYRWTEVLMREAGRFMDALALHKYTVARGDGDRLPATGFGEGEWFAILKNALEIGPIIDQNCAIMDQHDPGKRVALFIDEWGAWYKVEPGTNPGFLYQQNTLRDALVAAVSLDIFNQRCERVRMTNIAQTINVLQSMILTDGEKMLLTPTYHVFEMYKAHQNATLLPLDLRCADYAGDGGSIPSLSASASRDEGGRVHVTLSNLDPNHDADVSCELRGMTPGGVTGRVLSAGAIDAHNTFDQPEAVRPEAFDGARLDGAGLVIHLPARSVVALEVS